MNIAKPDWVEPADEEKSKGGRPKKEIDTETILRMRKEEKSIPEIAKELKVSESSLYRKLREGKKVKKEAGDLKRKEQNKLKEQQDSSK